MISYDEWVETYRPIMDDDGAPKKFDSHVPADVELLSSAHKNSRIWTVVESDGHWSLTSDYHYVNRLYYYITKVEYNEDVEVDYDH